VAIRSPEQSSRPCAQTVLHELRSVANRRNTVEAIGNPRCPLRPIAARARWEKFRDMYAGLPKVVKDRTNHDTSRLTAATARTRPTPSGSSGLIYFYGSFEARRGGQLSGNILGTDACSPYKRASKGNERHPWAVIRPVSGGKEAGVKFRE
jgi:hypothetical protein